MCSSSQLSSITLLPGLFANVCKISQEFSLVPTFMRLVDARATRNRVTIAVQIFIELHCGFLSCHFVRLTKKKQKIQVGPGMRGCLQGPKNGPHQCSPVSVLSLVPKRHTVHLWRLCQQPRYRYRPLLSALR